MASPNQQKSWLWKDLEYPAPADGEASVEFAPVTMDRTQDRAKLFRIAGIYQELTTVRSHVTGRAYRLKFQISAKLGAVYMACTEDSMAKFAVKRLDARVVSNWQCYNVNRTISPNSLENSAMEVHVMRHLGIDSPNLQNMEEYLYFPGDSNIDFPMYFQILPCADDDLLEYVIDRPLEAKHVYHFARRILNGLTYLHANGLCHLDISPENVLLYAGEPVVHDFGMATDSPVNSNWHNLMPHTCGGKDGYYPPEVRYPQEPYDGFKADIYSLGCTLHVLYCRTNCPKERGPGSLEEMGYAPVEVYQQKHERMSALRREQVNHDSNPKLANRLCEIIDRMVHISPHERRSIDTLLLDFDLVNDLVPSIEEVRQQFSYTHTRQYEAAALPSS